MSSPKRPKQNLEEKYSKIFEKLRKVSKTVAEDTQLFEKYKELIAEIDSRDLAEIEQNKDLTGDELVKRVKQLKKKNTG